MTDSRRRNRLARADRPAGRRMRTLAVVLSVALGAGESAVLYHLATAPHASVVIGGELAFLGTNAHTRPATPGPTAWPARGRAWLQSPADGSFELATLHRHDTHFSSARYGAPTPFHLTVPEAARPIVCAWRVSLLFAGAQLFRIAPKQSPPRPSSSSQLS